MSQPQPGPREATIERLTRETQIRVRMALDDATPATIDTPVGFLSHMLEALARHGRLGLEVRAAGDTQIDDHHTVEDVGIAIGQALHEALGDARGIERFAAAHCPLDGSLVRAVIDISGRPTLVWNVPLEPAAGSSRVDFALYQDFFKGLVDHAKITLHMDLLRGDHSNHHRIEAAMKAFAVALRTAVARTGSSTDVPSTKGVL